MAIGLRFKKSTDQSDYGASKLFGSPTVPPHWEYGENEIFFCQIRLSDIAELDKEYNLAHEGYLYVFFDVTDGEYHIKPIVRYYNGEPTVVIDDFNGVVESYEALSEPYRIEMYSVDDTEDVSRLFGVPSGWNYGENPPKMLMQFDPLDIDCGFLDSIDGYLYLFFGDDPKDLSMVTALLDFS